MKYSKPELTFLGEAHRLIASSILKGPITGDSSGDPSDRTNPVGYEVDEE
jgi:hypothetical protein